MSAVVAAVAMSPAGLVALAHATAGRPVFPCDPHSKGPLVPRAEGGNGFKDATTDAGQITAWWARWPAAMIGMPTGAVSGCFVVDIDVKDGKEGDRTWEQILRTFGPVPETWETLTATGGRHIWFAHPGRGLTVPNRVGRLGQGNETWGRGAYPAVPFEVASGGQLQVPHVDIRGDGGYVILPGSCLADGRCYGWEGSSDPDEGAVLAKAPDWLLALVVTPETTRATPPAGRGVAAAIAEGGRNDYLFRLGRRMRAQGLGEEAILAALLAENATRCVPPLTEAEVRATAGSSASKAPGLPEEVIPPWVREGPPVALVETVAGPEPEGRPVAPVEGGRRKPELRVVGGQDFDERPVIQLTAGQIPHHADALERHLIAMGSEIYQQGTRLVRIGRWEAAGGAVARPAGAGVLIDVAPEWLIDHATRRVNCQVFDGRDKKWKPTDAPTKLVNTLLARSGEWHFNHLLGFCDAPTLTPDGRVIDQQGYDLDSGLYLTDPPSIAAIGRVTPEEVAAASKYLYGLFDTFPFVSDADAAALLAMVMTALLRRVLPAAPIGCISASTPGTGKSLLADGIAVLATGRTASVAAIGKDAEELEKRVDALLLKGDTLCVFDNIDRAVKSDVLCQVSTQGYKSVRVLGLSRMVEAPTNVCLLMTGNNLTLLGDLARRTVVCNLDAGVERPELRDFKRNAITHLLERRAKGIRAALVIAKGYLDAGCPAVDGAPFGSFDLWDRMIRRPLMWAGWPDPLQPAESMREQDHEFAGMVELLAALLEATGGRAMTAADIALVMKERQGGYADSGALMWPLLHEAAETVLGNSNGWDGRVVGRLFRTWKSRILGGLRIVEDVSRGRMRGRYWRVERMP